MRPHAALPVFLCVFASLRETFFFGEPARTWGTRRWRGWAALRLSTSARPVAPTGQNDDQGRQGLSCQECLPGRSPSSPRQRQTLRYPLGSGMPIHSPPIAQHRGLSQSQRQAKPVQGPRQGEGPGTSRCGLFGRQAEPASGSRPSPDCKSSSAQQCGGRRDRSHGAIAWFRSGDLSGSTAASAGIDPK
jgi:hypothetical protein